MASVFQLTPLADKIAAFFGISQPVGGLYAPTPAATMVIDPSQGAVCQCVAPAGNATLNTSPGPAGQCLTVICVADSGGTRTFTFGNNFRSTGTAAPTASKAIAVEFISDGTQFIEMGRSSAAV